MNIVLHSIQTVFHIFVELRNFLYNLRFLRVVRVSVPVVSVGTLSFGGTGKTPVVMWIAQEIQKAGHRVVILSRGYRRRSYFTKIVSNTQQVLLSCRRAGDEPYLMAAKLTGIPVLVSKNLVKGAEKAIKHFKPDIILLDDGFQHRKIDRNLDIVLIDSPDVVRDTAILREPLKTLHRADVVVFTKYDWYENAAEIQNEMVKAFSCPVFQARYKPLYIRNDRESYSSDKLDRKTIWLLAGIGNPEYFKHTLEQTGSYVSRSYFFRDHARYSRWKIRRIIRKFQSSSANYLITTEKDWHKIKQWIPPETPCFYLDITVEIRRGPLLLKLICDAAYLNSGEEAVE